MKIDWRSYVRNHLPALNVRAERENEIVDELALQLEAAYDTALRSGCDRDEAMRQAASEVPDWQALARELAHIEALSGRSLSGSGHARDSNQSSGCAEI